MSDADVLSGLVRFFICQYGRELCDELVETLDDASEGCACLVEVLQVVAEGDGEAAGGQGLRAGHGQHGHRAAPHVRQRLGRLVGEAARLGAVQQAPHTVAAAAGGQAHHRCGCAPSASAASGRLRHGRGSDSLWQRCISTFDNETFLQLVEALIIEIFELAQFDWTSRR